MSGAAPPVIWIRVHAGLNGAFHLFRTGKKCTQRCTASPYKIRIKLTSYDFKPRALSVTLPCPQWQWWVYLLSFWGVDVGLRSNPED